MLFRSTQSNTTRVSYKEAILNGLPPEGGLYVLDSVMDMRQFFLYMDSETTFQELVSAISPVLLQGELNPLTAAVVAGNAFDFEPELQQLDEHYSILNLYNGPTGVFKDFGIAYIAALVEEFAPHDKKTMVLSAARGDTGVSIARAFDKKKNTISVILYPSGTIHGLDEAAFVEHGGNIIPIQIDGTFDDCQRLITEIMKDRDFVGRYNTTTANAINVGRLLPQTFYYLYAFIKVKKRLSGDLRFSVPCGNFGSLIAGLYAWKFGVPVSGFVAAMNANNAFANFFSGKTFTPKQRIATISPALDVCFPSNYERLASFYDEAPLVMRNMVFPQSIDDEATRNAMKEVWMKYNIMLDPHAAVAFAAAKKSAEIKGEEYHTVVLATAHPAKYAALVSETLGETVAIPEKLALLKKECEPTACIPPHIDTLESAIASCF
ncbi:MAG: threonine synthase [Treponema sp.]|jgi:threonine synthase|nr:threonine synthase [Treponema sp.]